MSCTTAFIEEIADCILAAAQHPGETFIRPLPLAFGSGSVGARRLTKDGNAFALSMDADGVRYDAVMVIDINCDAIDYNEYMKIMEAAMTLERMFGEKYDACEAPL